MGQFASQSLPLSDCVKLTVLREGKILPETFTVSNFELLPELTEVHHVLYAHLDPVPLSHFHLSPGLDR